MNDPNYWKKRYQHLWSISSKKEEFFKNLIFEETGLELEPYGLGAGGTDFIPGSAKDNGNEKGSPDFRIKGENVFFEVTGPLQDTTMPESGLWIRPDKLNYAYRHRKQMDEFFALYFPAADEWLIIHADQAFFEHVFCNKAKMDYFEINPYIRGKRERFICISYKNPFVKRLDTLISFLRDISE